MTFFLIPALANIKPIPSRHKTPHLLSVNCVGMNSVPAAPKKVWEGGAAEGARVRVQWKGMWEVGWRRG